GPPAPAPGTVRAPEGPTGRTAGHTHSRHDDEGTGPARAAGDARDGQYREVSHPTTYGAGVGPTVPGSRKGTPLRGTDLPPSPGGRKRGGLGAWARRLAGGRR